MFWVLDKVDKKHYLKLYPKSLHWLGINIDLNDTEGTWISPTVFLDSSRYEFVEIGKKVTISFDVTILVHDYSIVHAARTIGRKTSSIIYKNVKIGNNVFVDAKTTILPGSVIGDNCIVGGGSVVKGVLEPNSIYAGNPCRKIASVEDFANRHSDFLIP